MSCVVYLDMPWDCSWGSAFIFLQVSGWGALESFSYDKPQKNEARPLSIDSMRSLSCSARTSSDGKHNDKNKRVSCPGVPEYVYTLENIPTGASTIFWYTVRVVVHIEYGHADNVLLYVQTILTPFVWFLPKTM